MAVIAERECPWSNSDSIELLAGVDLGVSACWRKQVYIVGQFNKGMFKPRYLAWILIIVTLRRKSW